MLMHPRRALAQSLVAASVLCALGFAAPAWADNITITSSGAAYGYDTAYLNDSQFTFPNGSHSVDVYTGADLISGTDTTTGKAFSQVVFCDDVNNFLAGTPYSFSQGSLSSVVSNTTKLNQISALISSGTTLLAGGNYKIGSNTYTATEVSSALQMAIWTAEYQADTSNTNVEARYVNTGSGWVSNDFWISSPSNSTDVTLADTFLGYAVPGTWSPSTSIVELIAQNPTNNQNLTYYFNGTTTSGGSPSPVFEPASMTVLGMGMIGLVASRRRRRAKV